MERFRAILLLITLVAVALLRPIHWSVHTMGGHAGCHDSGSALPAEQAHAFCDHDHADAESPESNHPDHGAPAERDDLADCEMCLAIGLLATDVVAAPLHAPHTVPAGQPVPTSAALPTCQAHHAPLHARPPPASTI
jgi:hypothetical protein